MYSRPTIIYDYVVAQVLGCFGAETQKYPFWPKVQEYRYPFSTMEQGKDPHHFRFI